MRAGLLAVVLLMACGGTACGHTKVITIRQTVHEPAPQPRIPCIDCVPDPFAHLRET